MVKPWLYSVVGLVGFLVGTYVILTYGLPLVLPFAVALVLAEIMDPLVARLTWKGKVPRSVAVAVVLMLMVGVLTFGFTAAVARLVEELVAVSNRIPELYAIATEMGSRFAEQFGAFHDSLPSSIQGLLQKNLGALQGSLEKSVPKLTGTLGAIGSLPVFITNLLIIFISTFFISRDKRDISGFLLSLFPAVWRPKLRVVKEEVWASTMGWAKAQFTLILLTMIQTIIGLNLIGSEYAVTMGIVVGVADVLPVLGPAAVYLPWIAYCFIFGSKVFGIKLLILYALVAGIRQVLEVKLVGDQIGLHPLAILVSIYLGFHFFGGLGFVAGPLLAILLKSLIKSGLLPIFQDELPR